MDLEELSARAEIHDVLLRYCRGLDRPDMRLVRGCFHDDAEIDFPESLHKGGIDGFMEFISKEMDRFVRTMHFLGNSLIEFDGSDVAHVETYLSADHQGSDVHQWSNDTVKLWARYLDRFERRDGAWRIAKRRLAVDWMFKYPAEGFFDDHPDAHPRRDGTDPALVPVAGFHGTPVAAGVWP